MFGCGDTSNQHQVTTKDGTEIEENSSVEGQEEVLEEQEPVVAQGQDVLAEIQGEYFELTFSPEGNYYQEPCGYSMHSVSVKEVYEETGFWEIYWAGESYSIESATKEGADIRIKTNSEVEEEFWFLANDQEKVWNFSSGRKTAPEVILREDVSHVQMMPCMDKEGIMEHLPSSWYKLEERDGKEVIVSPCEGSPEGIDIISNAGFLDFRSGSDPNEIVSMYKLNSRVYIVHRSIHRGKSDTLVIHDMYSDVARIGKGTSEDNRFVSEAGKDIYEVIEEPCE